MYVLGFIFSEYSMRVLLIKKQIPIWQSGFYNGIGGKIKENETPIDAIHRKVAEGVGINDIALERFGVLAVMEKYTVHLFSGTTKQQFTQQEEGKPVWFFRNRLPSAIIPDLSWMVPAAFLSLTDSELFLDVIEGTRGGGSLHHNSRVKHLDC